MFGKTVTPIFSQRKVFHMVRLKVIKIVIKKPSCKRTHDCTNDQEALYSLVYCLWSLCNHHMMIPALLLTLPYGPDFVTERFSHIIWQIVCAVYAVTDLVPYGKV